MRTAASYRQLAEMCRIGAAKARDEQAKAALAQLHVEYLQLAEEAERLGVTSPPRKMARQP